MVGAGFAIVAPGAPGGAGPADAAGGIAVAALLAAPEGTVGATVRPTVGATVTQAVPAALRPAVPAARPGSLRTERGATRGRGLTATAVPAGLKVETTPAVPVPAGLTTGVAVETPAAVAVPAEAARMVGAT
ncbi:hypothetical protein [Microbispora sp. NBC_01389]|uniref:hypothetical protein n=1 Tax=Microbispora sp. NBC_01389 TaxID=2903584 RepID=UPI00324B29DF